MTIDIRVAGNKAVRNVLNKAPITFSSGRRIGDIATMDVSVPTSFAASLLPMTIPVAIDLFFKHKYGITIPDVHNSEYMGALVTIVGGGAISSEIASYRNNLANENPERYVRIIGATNAQKQTAAFTFEIPKETKDKIAIEALIGQ